MAITKRVGVLGLVLVCGAWSCGGTVAHGDSEASESDAGGASDGVGGGFGDGSVGGSSDGSDDDFGDAGGSSAGGGDSSGSAGPSANTVGSTTTRGGDAGPVTTRGDTTSDTSGSSDTTGGSSDTTGGSSDDSAVATSTSAGIGITGAGGMVGSSDAVTSTVNTTVGTTGSGGFGGDPTNNSATFSSISVTSTTGSGGTEPEPPAFDEYPYLDDCTSSYWNINSNYCSLNFTCADEPSQYGWISCGESGDGDASCSCNNYDFWPSYLVKDADFDSACAYASSACVAGTAAEEGKPVCSPAYLYQSTTYCNATSNCETPVDIEGAHMTKTGTLSAYCEQQTDLWACTCSTSDGRMNFRLDVSDGSPNMCVDALDWCEGEFTTEGPRNCEPKTLNAQTNSCSVNLTCTQDALVSGVPAVLNQSYAVTCERGDSEAWICECPGAGNLEVEAETGWDACTFAASDCTPE